jgi:hypothetical protein
MIGWALNAGYLGYEYKRAISNGVATNARGFGFA